jgi:hypothetical protein
MKIVSNSYKLKDLVEIYIKICFPFIAYEPKNQNEWAFWNATKQDNGDFKQRVCKLLRVMYSLECVIVLSLLENLWPAGRHTSSTSSIFSHDSIPEYFLLWSSPRVPSLTVDEALLTPPLTVRHENSISSSKRVQWNSFLPASHTQIHPNDEEYSHLPLWASTGLPVVQYWLKRNLNFSAHVVHTLGITLIPNSCLLNLRVRGRVGVPAVFEVPKPTFDGVIGSTVSDFKEDKVSLFNSPVNFWTRVQGTHLSNRLSPAAAITEVTSQQLQMVVCDADSTSLELAKKYDA